MVSLVWLLGFVLKIMSVFILCGFVGVIAWFCAQNNECLYSVFEIMIVLFFHWQIDFACVLWLKDWLILFCRLKNDSFCLVVEKFISLFSDALFTCLLVKSSPMAQVGPLREHPLRVAPRSHLGWIARAFLIRRGATGQLSAFCRPPENSRIFQSFLFH